MFGKQKQINELKPPPIATDNPNAVEVMRVWAIPGQPHQLTLRTTWKNPAAWGLLMADIARHAAQAYANEGVDAANALRRIRAAYEAEMSHPTDAPKDITPR